MRRVLVALLFLIAMTLAACAPTMDEVGARKAALTYWTTLPREAGSHLKDGHVTGAKPSTHDGHAGWEIVVDGAVVVPAVPEGYANPMVLFVDGSTGKVTVIAQG